MAFQASPVEPFTWFNADLSIASRLDTFLILKTFEIGSIEGRVFGNLIIHCLMMYFSALRLSN